MDGGGGNGSKRCLHNTVAVDRRCSIHVGFDGNLDSVVPGRQNILLINSTVHLALAGYV